MIEFFKQIDLVMLSFINHLPHPSWLVEVSRFFTSLGTFGSMWLGIGLGCIIVGGLFGRRVFWLIVAGLLSEVVLNGWVIKLLVLRPRPFASGLIGFNFYDTSWRDTSFMSGHAMTAIACALIISSKYPKAAWLVWPIAILISFSRIYLGAHWPMDVICGMLGGVIIGYCVLLIDKNLLKKRA